MKCKLSYLLNKMATYAGFHWTNIDRFGPPEKSMSVFDIIIIIE